MTRSERARWTDLQVLAFLWAFDEDGVGMSTSARDDTLTTRDVAAALGVSVGRAAHALGRLRSRQLARHGEFGWGLSARWRCVRDELSRAGLMHSVGPCIKYQRDTEAA